jgi:5-dehydro-4-deoxyglucarate dehydratase
MTLSTLQSSLTGLNAFPVTPFDPANRFDADRYAAHVDHQTTSGATSVFPACGTGEYAALGPDEYRAVIEVAVATVKGRLPVMGGVGVNGATSRDQLDILQKAGCDGALLLPPYLPPGDPAGLAAHYDDLVGATDLPVILYIRPEAPIPTDAVLRICERDHVIGVKDGTGDPERLARLARTLGHARVLINGMPTAELSAAVFSGVGVTGYSSAVYNFVPEIATAFRSATDRGDVAAQEHILDAFYRPFAELRDRRRGYAVSLIKAGVSALLGPVGLPRPPLPPVDPDTERDFRLLVDTARTTIGAAA